MIDVKQAAVKTAAGRYSPTRGLSHSNSPVKCKKEKESSGDSAQWAMLGRRSIPQYTGRLLFKDHKQLTESQWKYLRLFTAYCHYDVREDLAEQAEDPVRTATGLPLGKNGCFFLDSGVYNLM